MYAAITELEHPIANNDNRKTGNIHQIGAEGW